MTIAPVPTPFGSASKREPGPIWDRLRRFARCPSHFGPNFGERVSLLLARDLGGVPQLLEHGPIGLDPFLASGEEIEEEDAVGLILRVLAIRRYSAVRVDATPPCRSIEP